MALKLDVLANTRQFVTEMKRAGASSEDISDALDELRRQGDRAGDQLERSFRDIASEAKRADRAVDKVGDTSKKGFKKAGGASAEFKDEALQNFGEMASSFDGSMESIGQVATDTLGGVAAALPGIGIAAGVAALGIGGITNYLTEMGEKSEEIKNGIIDDFLQVGDALDQEAVDARARDILATEETRKQAELLSEILGINVGQAVLAMAGDFESAGVTVDEVMDGINTASGNVNTEVWEGLKNTVNSTTEAMEIGAQAAAAQADANKRTADRAKQDQERTRTEIQKTADKLAAVANGTYNPMVNVGIRDNTQATVDRIVRRINGRVASITINGRPMV